MGIDFIIILLILCIVSSCKTTKLADAKGKIYFEINAEETFADNIGGIQLNFDVVNKSSDDIVILKPNNTFDARFDLFSNSMECDDIPVWSSDSESVHIEVTENDYLTIKSKSRTELLMNGRTYGWLACDSDSVQIKIKYEPFDIIEEGDKYPNEKNQIMKAITNVNIYSRDIKFKLNR